MAKTNTPFLSLGSAGTIAKAITTQKRDGFTIVRGMPVPSYRNTLPQQYQRWLYFDYVYLWSLQSEATRAIYAAIGSRLHIPAMAAWMRYHLRELPDFAAYWKLDYMLGAITPDSSRNANHATIFGPSPIAGLIDGAAHFDGLNDYLFIAGNPTLDITQALTLECLARVHTWDTEWLFDYNKTSAWADEAYGLFYRATKKFSFLLAGPNVTLDTTSTYDSGTWYHVAATYDRQNMRIYVNGEQDGVSPQNAAINVPPGANAALGRRGNVGTNYAKANIDHFIIYNRCLDATEIKRHSKRRYPY